MSEIEKLRALTEVLDAVRDKRAPLAHAALASGDEAMASAACDYLERTGLTPAKWLAAARDALLAETKERPLTQWLCVEAVRSPHRGRNGHNLLHVGARISLQVRAEETREPKVLFPWNRAADETFHCRFEELADLVHATTRDVGEMISLNTREKNSVVAQVARIAHGAGVTSRVIVDDTVPR